ncbi:MAG: shikimate dehydrogenase [Fidelibacterota bacterium]
MKTFAVIGNPVEHSWSPELHQAIFRQTGLKAEYRKIEVPPNKLAEFVLENTLDGFNVTLPHKESIIPYLDALDYHAETLQAVNCVIRVNGKQVGYNMDWVGFKRALEEQVVDLAGYHTIILGAGGAARAVAYTLAQLPVRFIQITSRTWERASRLVHWLEKAVSTPARVVEWERISVSLQNTGPLVIINTTPLGMWPDIDKIPLDPQLLKKGTILIDTIYNPPETRWLKEGQKQGCLIFGGLEMFIAQGLASDRLWFSSNRLEKIDLNQIRKVLISP